MNFGCFEFGCWGFLRLFWLCYFYAAVAAVANTMRRLLAFLLGGCDRGDVKDFSAITGLHVHPVVTKCLEALDHTDGRQFTFPVIFLVCVWRPHMAISPFTSAVRVVPQHGDILFRG